MRVLDAVTMFDEVALGRGRVRVGRDHIRIFLMRSDPHTSLCARVACFSHSCMSCRIVLFGRVDASASDGLSFIQESLFSMHSMDLNGHNKSCDYHFPRGK